MTAEQERGVVARITMPRRRIGRSRLTEGEPSELDEHHFNRDVAAACGAQKRTVDASSGIWGGSGECRVVTAVVLELEVALTKGTDDAVFGGGTGINRERHTRTGGPVVAIAVLLAEVAVQGRRPVGAAVESGVGAQITADLDAGIGARDKPEASAIERTDLYVFDRLGLDRKIRGLSSADSEKRRRAKNDASGDHHGCSRNLDPEEP